MKEKNEQDGQDRLWRQDGIRRKCDQTSSLEFSKNPAAVGDPAHPVHFPVREKLTYHDLNHLAGSWSAEEGELFEKNIDQHL